VIENDGKISLKHLAYLYIAIVIPPCFRYNVKGIAYHAKHAAMLTVIFSSIFAIILFAILNKLVKSFSYKTLAEIICQAFGNVLGKFFLWLYFFWLSYLASVYLKYYGERVMYISTPNTSKIIFLSLMIIIVALALRSDFLVYARMGVIIFYLLISMIYISVVFGITEVDINELYPFSYSNIWGSVIGSFTRLSICGYFTYMMFFTDKIRYIERLKSSIIRILYIGGLMDIALILVTIGILGHNFIGRTSNPYFIASKQIKIFESLGRFDALIIALAIMGDFAIITFFSMVSLRIFQHIFNLKDYKPFINIYVIFIVIFSYYNSFNLFQLETFSLFLAVPLILFFSLFIPVILLIVGKLRRQF
jgi:spore germination protein KB